MLLLHGLADLGGLGGLTGLLLSLAAESGAVVGLVPLSEWSSVDLDHGGLGEGVGSDEFVVGYNFVSISALASLAFDEPYMDGRRHQ